MVHDPTNRYRIVALMGFGGGDRPPVFALAAELRDRGHQVSVLCDADVADLADQWGLPAIQLPHECSQLVFYNPSRTLALIAQRGEEITAKTPNPMEEWALACLPAALRAMIPVKPNVLISPLFCTSLASRLSRELKTPWVFVNPGTYFGEDATRGWSADFSGLVAGLIRYWILPDIQSANAVLHATDAEFDPPPASLPRHHHYIGPLLGKETGATPEFLTEPGHPWVLISLSTVPQVGELAIARAALQALKDRPVRVLLTLSPDHSAEELGPLPSNARLSGFVPHGPVLERACLVISHAGHGTVMRALWHGVPMVLVPWGRDQPGVAARAESLGVAVVVSRPDCTRENLAIAISRVLGDARYAETSRYASRRLRAEDPVATGCFCIESVAQTGTNFNSEILRGGAADATPAAHRQT
jgi:UDP:flavonoid glycosyltransferase YjiC (YdhE family)